LDKRSGGSVWQHGTYDAELNLLYFGVAPTYDTGPLLHPVNDAAVTSDALYTNCTIALNPDTGKLVWYYQHVANDQWDLDWVFERQIVSLTIDGRRRKVVMNVGKMAILDALDRPARICFQSMRACRTSSRISIKDWREDHRSAEMAGSNRPTVICPRVRRAGVAANLLRSADHDALSPVERVLQSFGPEGSGCSRPASDSARRASNSADGTMGRLQAIDVREEVGVGPSSALAAVHPPLSPPPAAWSSPGLDPALKAFDDTSGKLLWQGKLDDLPSGSIVTYSIDKTQYVAVVVGLRNNHVNDLSRTYNAFRRRRGIEIEPANGGAAIWVFAL
jgi:alcohol dehydrogenase (cytochrome c)